MVFGLSALAGPALGLVGGASSYRDANNASKAQRGYLDKALGQAQNAKDSAVQGIRKSRPYVDELLEVSRGIEDSLLGQVDSSTAAAIRSIRQQKMQTEAQLNQSMASRGLDSFTTRMGNQAAIAGQTSNAMSELQARMASQRMGAIQAGRGALMNGLSAKSNFEMGAANDLSNRFMQMAGIYGNVQVQAPNTSAGLAAFGNSLMESHRTSVLEKAITGGGPTP